VEYQKYGNKKPGKVIQTGIPVNQIADGLKIRKKRKLYFLGFPRLVTESGGNIMVCSKCMANVKPQQY
jgi:hypothetical protein